MPYDLRNPLLWDCRLMLICSYNELTPKIKNGLVVLEARMTKYITVIRVKALK